MSADNFTGVWFDGKIWRIQTNLSASDDYDTHKKLEDAFKKAANVTAATREAALAFAHDLDEGETEYGVRELRVPEVAVDKFVRRLNTGELQCGVCWSDPSLNAPGIRDSIYNCRCTLSADHDGRHEMHGPPDGPARLTLIAWYDAAEKTGGGPEYDLDDSCTLSAAISGIAGATPKVKATPEPKVKRQPVTYLWSKLNWDFLKLLAEIAHYAEDKYGSAEQYTGARLEGEKSPINHAFEHLRAYSAGEKHDKFGTHEHQLAAVAYNVMMEFFYQKVFGFKPNPVMAAMRASAKRSS